MSESGVNAVVLAGGQASEEVRQLTGVGNRALVPIGDSTMLDLIVDALAASNDIEKIFVVGDVPSSSRYVKVTDAGSMFDNLVSGLMASQATRALVVTSDIPFITTESIDDFIRMAMKIDVDFVYPIVDMTVYRKRFAALKRTTLKIREGHFTGGNIMMVRTAFVTSQPDKIRKAYELRKDVMKLGALLGPGLLLRVLVSQLCAPSILSLGMLEAGIARLLGAGSTVKAVVSAYPEVGTDIDNPEEIEAARHMLTGASPSVTTR